MNTPVPWLTPEAEIQHDPSIVSTEMPTSLYLPHNLVFLSQGTG